MPEGLDPLDYLEYIRSRWRIIAAACATALVLSIGVSLAIPKRYTATATLMIESSGAANAVSQIYLESLRSYESFASSDTLFAKAADRFHLRKTSSQSVESLKQQVLRVSKLRDTKILEIGVTLRDPTLAQSVAQFLAGETINMSRNERLAVDQESLEQAQQAAEDATRRLDQTRATWSEAAVKEPIEGLRDVIETSIDSQAKLREELVESEADLAEAQERAKRPDPQFPAAQVPDIRARVTVLQTRVQELQKTIEEARSALSQRETRQEKLRSDLDLALTNYEATSGRLRDLRATVGTRGEQLRLVDPGVVPQRPSSPNLPLNGVSALLLAAVASITYLSLAYGRQRKSVARDHAASRRHVA